MVIKEYLNDSTAQYNKKVPETEEEKQKEIDQINSQIQSVQESKDQLEAKLDHIIEVANSFTFSKKLVENLEKEFMTNPKEEFAQHCLRDTI